MAKSQAVNAITDMVSALQGNATLEALVGDAESPSNVRVYNYIPDKPTFPYVRVEYVDDEDFSTKDGDGVRETYRVHAFTNYRGDKEGLQIMDAVMDELHDATLGSVSGFILCRHVRSQKLTDPDEAVRHFFAEFDVTSLQ